jgi:hypothetical protein
MAGCSQITGESPAAEIKRVISGVSADEAVVIFAPLWVRTRTGRPRRAETVNTRNPRGEGWPKQFLSRELSAWSGLRPSNGWPSIGAAGWPAATFAPPGIARRRKGCPTVSKSDPYLLFGSLTRCHVRINRDYYLILARLDPHRHQPLLTQSSLKAIRAQQLSAMQASLQPLPAVTPMTGLASQ